MHKYKKSLDLTGYVVIPNFINIQFVQALKIEVLNSKNTISYNDRLGNLRRIEKFYNKGDKLIELDKKIRKLLEEIYNEEFIIFKDKYNAKPPGGEGFYAHYDGIFNWVDSNGNNRNGWYEYANFFVNSLVALDTSNSLNGTIQIANIHNANFKDLLEKTKKNGTPDLKKTEEAKCSFKKIQLEPGDMVFFNNKCPHKSSKNLSKNNRMTLYYTYNKLSEGHNYDKYFYDKFHSKNATSKSLSGQT